MKNKISKTKQEIVNKEYYKLGKKLDESESKIKNGLAKETASTGTPIRDLSGAAKTVAQISNVGGGSKEVGGGGIEDGLKTMLEHTALKAHLSALTNSQENREKMLIDDSDENKME